jgi:hypothetical protein
MKRTLEFKNMGYMKMILELGNMGWRTMTEK